MEKLKELKPDIVITDIRMPFKDGLTMIEEGLANHLFELVILTGYSEFEYAKQAITLGVTEYILKPIDFSLLRQALQKLREKRTGERQKTENSLGEWIEHKKGFSPHTVKVIELIEQHYAEKITLTELSERCNISTVHLNAKL